LADNSSSPNGLAGEACSPDRRGRVVLQVFSRDLQDGHAGARAHAGRGGLVGAGLIL